MFCVSVHPLASLSINKKNARLVFGDSISDKLKLRLKNYEIIFLLKIDPVFVHRRVRDNWKSGEEGRARQTFLGHHLASAIVVSCLRMNYSISRLFFLCLFFVPNCIEKKKSSTTDMNFRFSLVLFKTPPFVMDANRSKL